MVGNGCSGIERVQRIGCSGRAAERPPLVGVRCPALRQLAVAGANRLLDGDARRKRIAARHRFSIPELKGTEFSD
ncbi:MAG: hypothetical protein KatS3mg111_2990 [Pirellulaceae bacterium]|nr:MAG: hypothetical protein KatS3mg111_2990 [Pirellulaceae bacterium]